MQRPRAGLGSQRLSPAGELNNLRVVLVSPRNPLNIGAAARAMSNFGCPHLRLVNPYQVAFREARSARGGSAVLKRAKEFGSLADAVADCTLVVGTTSVGHRELHHPLWRLEAGARIVRKQLECARVALLFGSEKFGLSNDDLSHCHGLLRIPSLEDQGSMNLGQAVAVCLYEFIRKAPTNADEPAKTATSTTKDVERITSLLFEALQASGYVNPRTAATSKEKLRRLVRRLNIPSHDAPLWMGMLRQLLWKLSSERS